MYVNVQKSVVDVNLIIFCNDAYYLQNVADIKKLKQSGICTVKVFLFKYCTIRVLWVHCLFAYSSGNDYQNCSIVTIAALKQKAKVPIKYKWK